MSWKLEKIELQGEHVRLEPLSMMHIADLLNAATEARETYGLTFVPSSEDTMRQYVANAMQGFEHGQMLPFVTRNMQTGKIVGSTRFLNIENFTWPADSVHAQVNGTPDTVEIGSTWLAQSAQRTGINTEAKLLMLELAFEQWKVRCVRLKTDARNERSRNAILRIGAKFDGILRAHMPASDGEVRDSAYFSLLSSEWPEIKSRLRKFLSL